MPPRPSHRGARTYGPAIEGPRTVENDSLPSIWCPDTQREKTRCTREPLIWTDPPRSDASWRRISNQSRRQPRTATAGGSQNPVQDRQYRMLSMAKRPHNATRVPPISGQTAQFQPKSTAIRRPRTPCRPAGAWAMFLTNSCYKNDIGYNYAIISYFRVPEP